MRSTGLFCIFFLTLFLINGLGVFELSAQDTQFENAKNDNPKTLALTLSETIERALKNNVAITVSSYGSKVGEQNIIDEKAVFDPSVSLEFTADERANQVSSAFASPSVSNNKNLNWKAGIEQKLWTGTEWEAVFENTRNKTNSAFAGLNPQYSSEVNLNLTQPLLKNFGIDVNKSDIYISNNNRDISELEFKGKVIDVVNETEDTYWDLVFGIEDMKVKKKSLERARDLERRVKAQVDVGTLAPLEMLQAQAEVASREVDVIEALDNVKDRDDALKNTVNIRLDIKASDRVIQPLDRPRVDAKNRINVSQSIRRALVARPDYLSKKKELENKNIQIKFNKNQLYPALDLIASLGLNGIAGEARGVPLGGGGPIVRSPFDGNYGDALDNLADNDFFQWEVGLKLKYPIGNRSAKSRLTAAKLEAEQMLFELKDLEKIIVLEVREASRQIQTDINRVRAAQAALKFAREKLAAEEKKFKVGLSTSFNVLEFQEDLAKEQSREIQARVDYNKSLNKLRKTLASTFDDYSIQLSTRSMQ